MVQHLQAERVRLLAEVNSLEQNNELLKSQLAKTKERAQQKDQVFSVCSVGVCGACVYVCVVIA